MIRSKPSNNALNGEGAAFILQCLHCVTFHFPIERKNLWPRSTTPHIPSTRLVPKNTPPFLYCAGYSAHPRPPSRGVLAGGPVTCRALPAAAVAVGDFPIRYRQVAGIPCYVNLYFNPFWAVSLYNSSSLALALV